MDTQIVHITFDEEDDVDTCYRVEETPVQEHVGDIYSVPPNHVQSFDEWNHNTDQHVLDEPPPDYSDSEDETNDAAIYFRSNSDDVTYPHFNNPNSNHGISNNDNSHQDTNVSAPEISTENGRNSPQDFTDKLAELIVSRGQLNNNVYDDDPDYEDGIIRLGRSQTFTAGETVEPRKLPNPVLDSRERQDLHRELFMNQKLGIDPLRKKSELKKELDRRKEKQKQKEDILQQNHRKTSFDLRLEAQANKIKQHEDSLKPQPLQEEQNDEFHRVHSRIYKTKSANS